MIIGNALLCVGMGLLLLGTGSPDYNSWFAAAMVIMSLNNKD